MTETEKVRARIPILRGANPIHYLDSAATALMPESVFRAVSDYDSRARGNIGRGVHAFAEAADAAYEGARRVVSECIGAAPGEVVFVSGATAGLNLLAAALGETMKPGDSVLLSVAEHHSNLIPWQLAARRGGFNLRFIPVDSRGAPDLDAARKEFASRKIRVAALTHASNVTGAISDLPEFSRMARESGAVTVADGAQFAPHAFPQVNELGPDFYVFSGHKCGGPNGAGVLWGRRDALEALPVVRGGGGAVGEVFENDFEPAELPRRLEPGTPPISPAVGLGAALAWTRTLPLEKLRAECAALADELAESVSQVKGARILSARTDGKNGRVPIVSFAIAGAHSHDICEWLSARNVATRGGHHCAKLLMRALKAEDCVRASLGFYTTAADIRAAAAAVRDAAGRLR